MIRVRTFLSVTKRAFQRQCQIIRNHTEAVKKLKGCPKSSPAPAGVYPRAGGGPYLYEDGPPSSRGNGMDPQEDGGPFQTIYFWT